MIKIQRMRWVILSLIAIVTVINILDGPWPGTTKSNAEWFSIKERAIAQGFRYNSCSC